MADNQLHWSGCNTGGGHIAIQDLSTCKETVTANDFYPTVDNLGATGFVCPFIRLCDNENGIQIATGETARKYRNGDHIYLLGIKQNFKIYADADETEDVAVRLVWGFIHRDVEPTGTSMYVFADEIYATDGSPFSTRSAAGEGIINSAAYPWMLNQDTVNHEDRGQYHIVGTRVVRVRANDSGTGQQGVGARSFEGTMNWKIGQKLTFTAQTGTSTNLHVSKYCPFMLAYAQNGKGGKANIEQEYRMYWRNIDY